MKTQEHSCERLLKIFPIGTTTDEILDFLIGLNNEREKPVIEDTAIVRGGNGKVYVLYRTEQYQGVAA